MRRPAGGLDVATGTLFLGGAALVAVSLVAAVILLAPPTPLFPLVDVPSAGSPVPPGRASVALPADRVAAVLTVDTGVGAGGVARPGDHVDVLGYLSREITGSESVTRVLLQDAPVLSADRAGPSVALTLAVPQGAVLLLQEAQALGARPLVTVRGLAAPPPAAASPASFSDLDLARRLTGSR